MRINKLSPSTKVQGRWLCYLEDDTILHVGANEIADFGLYSGMDITDELRAGLEEAVKKSAVRDRALSLISQRALSRKELVDKLTAKEEHSPRLAEETADWLEDLGYINDAEYARSVARHYSAKGYGARRIQDELWKRGVPRDLWEDAKEEAEEPADGIDAFIARKLKGKTPDPKELKRVSDALCRRGYRWDEVRDGLRRYGAELEEESL